MELVWPARAYLPSYMQALERGWSANTVRPQEAQEELARIAADPDAFLRAKIDRQARGDPVQLPDGSLVRRLPGFIRWMWDGELCGSIGFRWQPGGSELPPHVLGHIGYSVVPWRRGRGYATTALRQLLADVRREGLTWVTLTTDPDNIASQRVITHNGGVLVERFVEPAAYGGAAALRWRIDLR